jgi:hypothetical protein
LNRVVHPVVVLLVLGEAFKIGLCLISYSGFRRGIEA